MSTSLRFTTHDLELMPDDGKRYEVIDGELYVSAQPHVEHQYVCQRIGAELDAWSEGRGDGVAIPAPGLIFAEDEAVAPDVIWASTERLRLILEDGKLHAAPELVVEALSPGAHNQQRDRDIKLKLYSRRGVREYWLVDWQQRSIDVFRRHEAALHHVTTLLEEDTLESPLLPAFSVPLKNLFWHLPKPTGTA